MIQNHPLTLEKSHVLFCRRLRSSQKEMALGFVLKNAKGAFIVLGGELNSQLAENIDIFLKAEKDPFPKKIDFNAEGITRKVIHPSLWSSM